MAEIVIVVVETHPLAYQCAATDSQAIPDVERGIGIYENAVTDVQGAANVEGDEIASAKSFP